MTTTRTNIRSRRGTRAWPLALIAVAAVGCGTSTPSSASTPDRTVGSSAPLPTGAPISSQSIGASAEPAAASPNLVLVAIGDSIPYNLQEDCPGCTGFVDAYGAALEAEVGQRVDVLNRSRHDGAQTFDILVQLESDEDLLAELASADVIVTSIGFNDQPPFIDAYDGCPEPVTDSDSIQILAERAAATSRECIDSAVLVLRRQVAEVFAIVREQAPGAGIGALTPYDTWLGWSGLDSVDPPARNDLHDVVGYWMHEYREAMCAEAEAIGAVCVDVYSAFNGPEGTQPPTDFVAGDYTHPSQEGNDVIRELLVEADLADGGDSGQR